jgi:hypothetical protein
MITYGAIRGNLIMEKIKIREENGTYDIDVYKDENYIIPVGGLTIDSKRNQYYVVLPSDYLANYGVNVEACEDEIPEIVNNLFVERIAKVAYKNAKNGETKPYVRDLIGNIIKENPNIDYCTYKEQEIIDTAIDDIKSYNKGLISEDRILR